MKKRIIICVTCIAVAGIYVADGQNKNTITATENHIVPPPPPPPPPFPPAPPVDGIDIPAPPAPPMPPLPPVPAVEKENGNSYQESVTTEIINNNGNEITIVTIKGTKMVVIKKDGKTQRIKLSTWNANRKYYEKKYGQLPPPPPPPPVVEEVEFTPPVIKKDN